MFLASYVLRKDKGLCLGFIVVSNLLKFGYSRGDSVVRIRVRKAEGS